MAILGLCIGSFLNVVIVRLPITLQKQWQEASDNTVTPKRFNIITPRSQCPHCKQSIKAHHNIPVLSYFLLKGKCAHCQQHLSLQYPFVEILTAVLSVWVLWQFGISWQGLYALILTWGLIALSFIDWKEQLLPDQIVLPLLWLGLIINCFGIFTAPTEAIFAAAIGYITLWLVATAFLKLRHKQGMGHGDFKLFAMLGAWFGIYALLNIILMASIVACIVMGMSILFKRHRVENAFAFGPYLSIAGWLTLMYGDFIVNWVIRI